MNPISQRQRNICYRLLEKNYPDIHAIFLRESGKAFSEIELTKVKEVKRLFDELGLNDRTLFVAVIFRLFHPALYEKDNRFIPVARRLNKEILMALNMDASNVKLLINKVRLWLTLDIEDLRTKTDEFFNENNIL